MCTVAPLEPLHLASYHSAAPSSDEMKAPQGAPSSAMTAARHCEPVMAHLLKFLHQKTNREESGETRSQMYLPPIVSEERTYVPWHAA